MNAKIFGLAGLWAVTAVIAAVAIGKLSQTGRLNEQLRAELAEREAVDSERRQEFKETARSESLTRDEKLELLRLRSEVTQLKAAVTASREVVKSALENREEAMTRVAAERNGRQNDNSFNTADLTFRGYATPEDGYASGIAAMKEGDIQKM